MEVHRVQANVKPGTSGAASAENSKKSRSMDAVTANKLAPQAKKAKEEPKPMKDSVNISGQAKK